MLLNVFIVLAGLALLLQILRTAALLFSTQLSYRLTHLLPEDIQSKEFLQILEALTDAPIRSVTRAELLMDGGQFYPAEVDAIRSAQHSVNVEAYIFAPGRVADDFLRAMVERAERGVAVRVVVDAVGSFFTPESYFDPLRKAGGQVFFYHPLRWPTLLRLNHRTHRELVIVDGKMAFIGGAGVKDHWLHPKPKRPAWCDTMVRIQGTAVDSLQTTFIENWLEASGEVLSGSGYFQGHTCPESDLPALVVNSTPSAGASTRARMLFGALISAAKKSICMNTPYFLPDAGARETLLGAARAGVQVRIIVPGLHTDHALVRFASRRYFGELLEAGAEIYEYQRAMIHRKLLIVDSMWVVAGSTNFDHRSFGLNDEVNIAICSTRLAAEAEAGFTRDLHASERLTLEEWKTRPIYERFAESLSGVLERLQ